MFEKSSWYMRGLTLYSQGKYSEAIECFDEAISLDENDADPWSSKGDSLYKQGKYTEAIECFDEAIILDENDPHSWNGKGIALYRQGKHRKAIECFDKAIELDPNNYSAYFSRGLSKHCLKDFFRAENDYDKAIELNSKYAKAYCSRGNTRKHLKRYKKAIEDYNKAIELNPNCTITYYSRGVIKAEIGKLEEAIADYNEVIKLDPNDVDVYYYRGKAKNDLGQYVEAIKDYDKAIKLGANFMCLWRDKALAHLFLKDLTQAKVYIEKAISLNLLESWTHCIQGVYAFAANDKAKYREHFQLIQKYYQKPENTQKITEQCEIYSSIVKFFIQYSAIAEAEFYLQIGLSIKPDEKRLLLLKKELESLKNSGDSECYVSHEDTDKFQDAYVVSVTSLNQPLSTTTSTEVYLEKNNSLAEQQNPDYGKNLCDHIILEPIPETFETSVNYLKKSTRVDPSFIDTKPENMIENTINYEMNENNEIKKIEISLREEISHIRRQLQSVKQDQWEHKGKINKKLADLEKTQQLCLQYYESKEAVKKEREELLYHKGESLRIYYQTFTTRLCAAFHAIRLLQSGLIKRQEGSINDIKGLQSSVSTAAKVANIGMSVSEVFLNNLDNIASATAKVGEVISSAGLKLCSSGITEIASSVPILGTIASAVKVASEFAINTLDKRTLATTEDCLNQFTAHALEKLADEIARCLSYRYEEQINLLTPKSAARFAECGVNRVLAGLFNNQIKGSTFVQDALTVIHTYEINQAQIKIEAIQVVFGIPFRAQRLEVKVKSEGDITEDKLYRKVGYWMQKDKESWFFSNDSKLIPDGIHTCAKEVGYIKTDKIPDKMRRDIKRLGPSCLFQVETASSVVQQEKMLENQELHTFSRISRIKYSKNHSSDHLTQQWQRNRTEGDECSQMSTLWLKMDFLTAEISSLKSKSNSSAGHVEPADFKKTLTDLIVKEKFKFSFTYSKENQLTIQFTAINSVIMTTSEIRDHLVKLIKLFNYHLITIGFENQYEFSVDWASMKFVVSAKNNECMSQILTFLKSAGENYWNKNYFNNNVFTFFGVSNNKGKALHEKCVTTGEQDAYNNSEQNPISCALQ